MLDLSCRRTRQDTYVVVTNRWQTFTDLEVNEQNLVYLAQYCDEFLVHGVDVEGLKMGIEEDLVALVCFPSFLSSLYFLFNLRLLWGHWSYCEGTSGNVSRTGNAIRPMYRGKKRIMITK